MLDTGIAVLEADTHVSRWIEETGRLCHDRVVEQFIIPLINEGDWVVDGGAFIGDHTIAYAEKVGAKGKVFAFEPCPSAFECLEWNMRNHPNVVCQQDALSDRQKRRTLVKGENAGAAFLNGEIGDVRCIALDSIPLERLNYIKLDVEGHELFALRGMQETLAKYRPKIVLEMNSGALGRNGHSYLDVLKFLKNAEYSCKNLLGGELPLDTPQFDLLAERETG